MTAQDNHQPITVGRYLLHRRIARGGMATIHIARLIGDVGFSRIVAAKRMHPELAEDSEFVAMFLDEARIASRVQHRNVVNVLDVVTLGEEVMLVQEYVHGVPLGSLLRTAYENKAHVPVPVAATIACQILAGLHAAHETVDEMGTPLQIVHRDVSPQNIMIAVDGTARLLDFGVAKAALSAHVTRKGTFKGKLAYSSPEQIRGEAQRQSDVYSLAVVLWELIVGHRLHGTAQSDGELIAEILAGKLPKITEALADQRSWIGSYRWSQIEAIEPVICKALDTSPRRRWATAADMEEAIAASVPLAPAADVAAWLRAVGKDFLDERDRMIAEEEASWRRNPVVVPRPGSGSDVAPSTATDSTGLPPPRSLLLLRRVPTAIIAMLVVAIVVLVAFLARDLDSAAAPGPSPEPALPATATADGPPPSHAPTSVPAAERAANAPASEPSREQPPLPHDEPPVSAPRPVVRTRVVRTAPPHVAPLPARTPAPPPPKPATVTLDCSTPFYFEGRKKIFKPGCL